MEEEVQSVWSILPRSAALADTEYDILPPAEVPPHPPVIFCIRAAPALARASASPYSAWTGGGAWRRHRTR